MKRNGVGGMEWEEGGGDDGLKCDSIDDTAGDANNVDPFFPSPIGHKHHLHCHHGHDFIPLVNALFKSRITWHPIPLLSILE